MAFYPFGGQTYTLNSSISSVQNTINLTSFTEPVTGTPYTMALINSDVAYGTIAPKTTSSEFISFTGITQNVDGTATLTGVTRGLAKKYPFTTDSAYKLPHSGQSIFIISDAPQVFEEFIPLRNDVTITGVKTFSSSPIIPTGGTGTQAANNQDIANAVSGASGTATNSTFGTVKLSVAAVSAPNPIVVGDNDTRVPTQSENDALVGNSGGQVSSSNKFEDSNDTSSGIDQSQITRNASAVVGAANATGNNNKIAQSFIAGQTSQTGVSLNKQADTSSFTGTVTISLQADSAGSPSGSALATQTINNANWLLIPTGNFATIFASPYAATIGTTYWIVIETSTSDTSNHPNIGTNSAGGYASGGVKRNNTTDGWTTVVTIDLYFKTYTAVSSKVMRATSVGMSPTALISTATGATDAYWAVFDGLTSLVDGMLLSILIPTSNTGTASLNPNGLGAITIVKNFNATLNDNDLKAGQWADFRYDATNTKFQMQSQTGNSSNTRLFTGASDVTISGTTTETTLFTGTLPGNTLGSGNTVRGRLRISHTNLANTNTATIRVKYGGTTLSTAVLTANSSSDIEEMFDFEIIAAAATNAQEGTSIFWGTSTSTERIAIPATATSAIDSTADQTLLITGQVNNSANNLIMRNYSISVDR